jgi:hypothetical protein
MPTLGPSSKSYAVSGLQARKFILNKNIAEAMRGLTKAEIHQLEMLAGERLPRRSDGVRHWRAANVS